MCNQCDYNGMLSKVNLEATTNRLRVLEVIGSNKYPLSVSDIHNTLNRSSTINRVTVYRILDLLVDHNVVDRISTGGRSFYYGLAPNSNHSPHPHFYCNKCGQMDCLSPGSLKVDINSFGKTFPGQIDRVEVRIDGICKNCRNQSK